MNIQNRPYLSFGSIAEKWACELEESKAPGRFSRDEIFLELIRAIWRCEFEDENGENSALTRHRPPEGGSRKVGTPRYVDANQQDADPIQVSINRRWLLSTMPPVAGLRLPAKPRLRPSAGDVVIWKLLMLEISWDRLVALELDRYDPNFCKTFLAAAMISKKNFRQWCDDHGHVPPAFWFGQAIQSDRPSVAKVTDDAAKEPDGESEDVSDNDSDKPSTSNNEQLKQRIENVFIKAKSRLEINKLLGERSIARNIERDQTGGRFEGYKFSTVYKILRGKYRPAARLGYSSLSQWTATQKSARTQN